MQVHQQIHNQIEEEIKTYQTMNLGRYFPDVLRFQSRIEKYLQFLVKIKICT